MPMAGISIFSELASALRRTMSPVRKDPATTAAAGARDNNRVHQTKKISTLKAQGKEEGKRKEEGAGMRVGLKNGDEKKKKKAGFASRSVSSSPAKTRDKVVRSSPSPLEVKRPLKAVRSAEPTSSSRGGMGSGGGGCVISGVTDIHPELTLEQVKQGLAQCNLHHQHHQQLPRHHHHNQMVSSGRLQQRQSNEDSLEINTMFALEFPPSASSSRFSRPRFREVISCLLVVAGVLKM